MHLKKYRTRFVLNVVSSEPQSVRCMFQKPVLNLNGVCRLA